MGGKHDIPKSVGAGCYGYYLLLFHRLALITKSDFLTETNGFKILEYSSLSGNIYIYYGLLKENNGQ